MEGEDYEVLRSPQERSLEVGVSTLYRGTISSPKNGGRFAREGTAGDVIGSLPEYNEEDEDDSSGDYIEAESVDENEEEAGMYVRARRGSFYGQDELYKDADFEGDKEVEDSELRQVFAEDYDHIIGETPVVEEELHFEEGVQSIESSVVEEESEDDDEEVEAEQEQEDLQEVYNLDEDKHLHDRTDNIVMVDVKVPVSKAVEPRSLRLQRRGIRASERIGEESVVVDADREVHRIEGLKLMPEGTLAGPRLEQERPLFIVKDKKKRPINTSGPPLLVERAGARPEAVYNKNGRIKRLDKRRNKGGDGATTPWHGDEAREHRRHQGHRNKGPSAHGKRSRKRGQDFEGRNRGQGGFLRRLLKGR